MSEIHSRRGNNVVVTRGGRGLGTRAANRRVAGLGLAARIRSGNTYIHRVAIHITQDSMRHCLSRSCSRLIGATFIPNFHINRTPQHLIRTHFGRSISSHIGVGLVVSDLDRIGSRRSLTPVDRPSLSPRSIGLPRSNSLICRCSRRIHPRFAIPS